MATNIQVVASGQFWFVVTPDGRVSPMDTEAEAICYARLLQLARAAGSETACTDSDSMG